MRLLCLVTCSLCPGLTESHITINVRVTVSKRRRLRLNQPYSKGEYDAHTDYDYS